MPMLIHHVSNFGRNRFRIDIDGIRIVKGTMLQLEALIRALITHYSRILEHVKPDKIHVLIEKIVKTEACYVN